MQKLVHTPEGVRDIYGEEYAAKLTVEEQIGNVFHSYGYRDIQTPTFEFFDVFSREIGTKSSRDLYKFLTRKAIRLYCGRILRRRLPDARPSISRRSAGRCDFVIRAMRSAIRQSCRES